MISIETDHIIGLVRQSFIMDKMRRPWYLIVLILALGGCASIDFDRPKSASSSLPAGLTGDTHLGRMLEGLADAHPGQSGFYPIGDGIDALGMRLLMIERAERSIDGNLPKVSLYPPSV